MHNNKTFLAIIPARGGSKRLPRKNILDLAGKPLISWSINAGLRSQYIDRVVVTSDSAEILEISEKIGADVLQRPRDLASDVSTTFDAIKHSIDNLNRYDYIVLLQPTSPLRNENHIDEAIELLGEKNADAVISVCKTGHSPLLSNTLPDNGSMEGFVQENLKNKRSQDLEEFFIINGAIYICETNLLLKEKSFLLRSNIFSYRMKRDDSVDIDDRVDFVVAESFLSI
jgi:CMP-N,N'-diacetyllegionaminic acid synthase